MIYQGQIADANEVLNAYGQHFANWIQPIYNAQLSTWNSGLSFPGTTGSFVTDNLMYSKSPIENINGSYISSGATCWFANNSHTLIGRPVADFTAAGSLWTIGSSTNWSTFTRSVSGLYVAKAGSATAAAWVSALLSGGILGAESNLSSGATTNKVVILPIELNTLNVYASSVYFVQLSDGATHIDLGSDVVVGSYKTITTTWTIVYDTIGKSDRVDSYKNNTLVGSRIDVSGILTSCFIRVLGSLCSATDQNAELYIFPPLFLNGNGSGVYVSNFKTMTPVSGAWLTTNQYLYNGSLTHYLSNDGGSTWTEAVPNQYTRFPVAGGSAVCLKTVGTINAGSINADQYQVPVLSKWAILGGTY